MSHQSSTRRPSRAILAALPAMVLVLAACTSSSSSSEPPASQAAASHAPASHAPAASQAPASETPAGGTTVTMSGLAFSVAEITVPVGKLTFVNNDAVLHLIAEGEDGVEVASPRVQKVSINGGTQGDLVFTVAGDYHITCLVHKTMNMEVHVQ
jgi:plastocyanin